MPEPEKQERKPSPNFYKVVAVAFLVIGLVLIWQAAVHHDWRYWAFGIMTIINAIVSMLKSRVPRETKD
jgi:uncharacterized membrane protein HdeD (DUF308 family)